MSAKVSNEFKKNKPQETVHKHKLQVHKPQVKTPSILKYEHRKDDSWERRRSPGFTFSNLVFPPDLESRVRRLEEEARSLLTVINVTNLIAAGVTVGGIYTKLISIPAEALGRPNVNPPTVVDHDNLTLYRFTLNTDRMTIKLPPPHDYASGPLEFNIVWTNDGGVDDANRNVRWELNYQTVSEDEVVSGNHANSPKLIDGLYDLNIGWIEQHTGFIEIAEADFLGKQCIFIRLRAVTPPNPPLTCEPHLIGICLRYSALRIPV
ncbi:hypothetical protein ES702_00368 [subsurface metagenome]